MSILDRSAVGAPGTELKRGLKNRHLQMISLGSAIGTGLFLVSGSTIQTAGPVVLVGYVIAGIILFFMMRMLGEMAVAHPVSGSWVAYSRQYLGKLAGFITGWNWWYTCIVVCMLELTAAGEFMNYWFPHLQHWVTALVCLVLLTCANMIDVKAFGEFEFYFTLIKVAAVIAMIVFGVAIIFGASSHYEVHGLSNLYSHGGFAPKGLGAFILSLVSVTFTFGGIESLGTSAGEVEEPGKNIPRAINQVLLRIMIFYVGAIGVMLIIWPWSNVGSDGSPFVLMLEGIGIGGAATVLNVVVLTASLSVLNVMTYSNSRVLYDLAGNGQAPRWFRHVSKNGVPIRGLLVNSGFVGIVVLLDFAFPGQVLTILISIILGNELITWSTIVLSHLKFRRAHGKGAFPTPLAPAINVVCLGYFALIYILMFKIKEMHSGVIALPLWLGGLILTGLLVNRAASRTAKSALDTSIGAS